jgi:hypothetical protein
LTSRHVCGVRVAGVERADVNTKQAFVAFHSQALRSAKRGAKFCMSVLQRVLALGWSLREQSGRHPIVNNPIERTRSGTAALCSRATLLHAAAPLHAVHLDR